MGGYNTSDTVVRDRRLKKGYEINLRIARCSGVNAPID